MSKYKIKTLITRGHDKLRCEDDFVVNETQNLIVCGVFDGCSSGLDSHIASTILKKIMMNVSGLEFAYQLCHKNNDKDYLKYICQDYIDEIYFCLNRLKKQDLFFIKEEEDLLSTAIILVLDKNNGKYFIQFAGDGVAFVDGEVVDVHNEDNSVTYLSTILEKNLDNYINSSKSLSGTIEKTLSISTDGIDTFKDVFGITHVEEARELFFKSERFVKTDGMLTRLYNIFTKESDVKEDGGTTKKTKLRNIDDFTMIRIIKEDE